MLILRLSLTIFLFTFIANEYYSIAKFKYYYKHNWTNNKENNKENP